MRVGAGGIMLPNHAPLVIAEQFGTLESLFPGRIDLALGRAPGSDQITARALRRKPGDADTFPQDVLELIMYFEAPPGQRVQAIPGAGLNVPVWILGSSLYGAQLAAELGLPYGFASHFSPALMMDALAVYRQRFRPSEFLARPHVMLGVNVVVGETDEEAKRLFTSHQQAFVEPEARHPRPAAAAGRAFQRTAFRAGEVGNRSDPVRVARRIDAIRAGGAGGVHRSNAGRRADFRGAGVRPRGTSSLVRAGRSPASR